MKNTMSDHNIPLIILNGSVMSPRYRLYWNVRRFNTISRSRRALLDNSLIMAALRNRSARYIFALWFLSSSSSSIFLFLLA